MPEIVAASAEPPRFLNEAQLVPNIALGAALIWRFVAGYDQADLVAAFDRRLIRRLAEFAVPLEVLENDRRVVDQDSDDERHPQE